MDELIQRQQQEIDTLRERVRQLEDILMPHITVPPEWCLTSTEARVFAHLTTKDVATKQSIMLAIYSDRVDAEPDQKIVDVFVCKIRKKLAPHNVEISTIWGQGYSLKKRRDYQLTRNEAHLR